MAAENLKGGVKYTPYIKQIRVNANFGRFAQQDDLSLQAIILGRSETNPKCKIEPRKRGFLLLGHCAELSSKILAIC